MEVRQNTAIKNNKFTFFSSAYGLFTLAGLGYFFLGNDLSMGITFFGVALVFDPFDQSVTWKDRPLYQRVWLVIHVVFSLAAFFYMIFFNPSLSHTSK
jgi:hypothetical protein